jgi:Mitotic checkpoint protein
VPLPTAADCHNNYFQLRKVESDLNQENKMKRTLEDMNHPLTGTAAAAVAPHRTVLTTTTTSTTTTPSSSSFLPMNSSSTNITILHQQQQMDSLQIELDHERDGRRLDQKKSQHAVDVLQQKLLLLQTEMKQLRTLYDDTTEHDEKRIQQLTEARNKALHLNRQYQIQMEGMTGQHDPSSSKTQEATGSDQIDAELERFQVLNERLNEQILKYKENEFTYQNEIVNLKRTVEQKLQAFEEKSLSQYIKHPLLEEAPASVLQELNRCRIQLANRERQIRQMEKRLDSQTERCNALLHETEVHRMQTKRYPLLQSEIQSLHQQYAKQEAELNAWNDFAHQLNEIIQSSSLSASGHTSKGTISESETPTTQHTPPEITTILRYLEMTKQQLTQAQKQMQYRQTLLHENRDDSASRSTSYNPKDESAEPENQHEWKEHEYKIQLHMLSQQFDLSQNQILLYQREIDSYKQLIETYEQQIQFQFGKEKHDDRAGSSHSRIDPAYDTLRIQSESTKERLELLQDTHMNLVSQLQDSQTERAKSETELDRVRVKYKQLKDALDTEKDRRVVAEERMVQAELLSAKGSFDAGKTRILHFAETPLVQALKEEVEVLKRQLEQSALSTAAASSASPSDTSFLNSSSTAGMEAIVTPGLPNPEKLIQRLKENFKEQIAFFREGVYMITGYKVEMLPNNSDRPVFRLRSVFAENEDDQLLIQWSKDIQKNRNIDPTNSATSVASLDILDTDLAKILATTPSYEYMSKFHSLPAFLASVQLSLFEKQTVFM